MWEKKEVWRKVFFLYCKDYIWDMAITSHKRFRKKLKSESAVKSGSARSLFCRRLRSCDSNTLNWSGAAEHKTSLFVSFFNYFCCQFDKFREKHAVTAFEFKCIIFLMVSRGTWWGLVVFFSTSAELLDIKVAKPLSSVLAQFCGVSLLLFTIHFGTTTGTL